MRRAKPCSALWMILAPLLAAVSGGCAVSVSDRDVWVRRDVENDALDSAFVDRGVSVAKGRSLEHAPEEAERILAGGLFDWNLDELSEPDLAEGARSARWRSLLEGISVREVFPSIDERGRLSCFQRLRVPHARALLLLANEMISEAVLERSPAEGRKGSGSGEGDGGDDALYPTTLQSCRAAAERGFAWIRLDGQGLALVIPAVPGEAARFRRELLRGVARNAEGPFFAALIESVEITPQTARVRIGRHTGDVPQLLKGRDEAAYDTRLLEALRSCHADWSPREGLGIEDWIAMLEPR